MPLYEYQCSSCQKIHEVMQKFSDPPLGACPDCGAPVQKLMSMSSFALKGSGWYTTDYKKAGASRNPEKPSTPSKTETKTESAKTDKPTGSTDSK